MAIPLTRIGKSTSVNAIPVMVYINCGGVCLVLRKKSPEKQNDFTSFGVDAGGH